MRISEIRAIPVNVPYRAPTTMSAGVSAFSTRTIVAVTTDTGLTGLGEASYGLAAGIVERDFAPAIIGLDPLDPATVRRHCLPDALDYGTPLLKLQRAAWGGLEIALWDLKGKAEALPLYRLLGGKVRERALFGAYAYTDPDPASVVETMPRRAIDAIDMTSAAIFEFKVGVHPVETDIETVEAVSAALGGRARIAVDANMGMTVAAARRFLDAAGGLLENFEEPVPGLANMEILARASGVPVSTHCADMETMEHYPGISGIVPTLDAAGGVAAILGLADACMESGRRLWIRSHAEAGIGWAAVVHLGAALPALERPAQSLIDLIEDDLVLGEPWLVQDGGVIPPDCPGLGVEPDWPAIRRCHELYVRLGEQHAFKPPLHRPVTALSADGRAPMAS
ncbi:MAG TPA: mandelate racemase/muconate lactonizing enzyme family protein [Stellaceae bacterium]|nr:mandelate racemase/muconate lactonizing enzyme family protein [Stellaceae bacterium]